MKRVLSLLKLALPYLWIVLGSAVYALGFVWFYMPNRIAYGGVTGIAQIINAIFGWPSIGVIIILVNIPLFLAGWRLLGRRLLINSLLATALSSLFIDLISGLYTFSAMEPLLACIYGGVSMGASLGLIFLQGATTGGTDIAARLLKLRVGWLPMGRIILILDLVVIVSAAAVFRSSTAPSTASCPFISPRW
jgi:uncharacterized membrane-anchored protein YitT (DUF2179 family)